MESKRGEYTTFDMLNMFAVGASLEGLFSRERCGSVLERGEPLVRIDWPTGLKVFRRGRGGGDGDLGSENNRKGALKFTLLG